MDEHREPVERTHVLRHKKNTVSKCTGQKPVQFKGIIDTRQKINYRYNIKFPGAKRLSPMLILIIFLFFFFPYLLFTGTGSLKNQWLILLFPLILANALMIDFALWNYYTGKKKLTIWMLELPLSVSTILLLLKKDYLSNFLEWLLPGV